MWINNSRSTENATSYLSTRMLPTTRAINLISSLKVGETIDLSSHTIIQYTGIYAAMQRWWNGESTEKLIKWVYDIVLFACRQTVIDRNMLIRLIHGVRNLTLTYAPSLESNTLDGCVEMMEEILYAPVVTTPISINSSCIGKYKGYSRSFPLNWIQSV